MSFGHRHESTTRNIPELGISCNFILDSLVGAADQRCQRTVVAVGIDPVDALVLDSADARAEAQAQHGEGGEVDLGIAVGVGVMLFDLELALVVKQTVQYKGGITVGTLNRQAVVGATWPVCFLLGRPGKSHLGAHPAAAALRLAAQI